MVELSRSNRTIARGLSRLSKVRDRLFAIVDQALMGAGNLVVLAVVARITSKAEFGALGAAFGLHFILFGFHRANLVLPYLLTGHDERAARASHWAWLAIACSLCTAGALIGAWLLSRLASVAPTFASEVALYAATLSPALLLQEFAKRWLYQAGLSGWVAIGSALSLVLTGLGLALLVHAGPTGLGAAAVLGTSALVAPVLAFSRVRPRDAGGWSALRQQWAERRRFALWQSATHVPYVVYNNGYVLLLSFWAGPLVAASFTALRTMLSPAASLISAVDSVDKPRALRAYREGGVSAARQSLAKTRKLLVGLNAPALLGVSLLAAPVQTLVFGPEYVNVREAWVMAAYFLLLSINQPFESLLTVQERGRALFLSRSISAAVALVGLALARGHGLFGAVLALLAAQALNCVLLWLLSRRA